MAGMPMSVTTCNKVVKTPYSSLGIFLAIMWTVYMNTPPAILAIISQPLWRKKATRWAVWLMGWISALAASILTWTPCAGFSSRKRLQKAQQHGPGSVERCQRNPLVGCMGLGNVARTKHNAGDA